MLPHLNLIVPDILLHNAELLFRIVAACILGGIVGYEREQTNRPAGFRTHILVCVGAALVMMTGEFIHDKFGGNTDPARIGAQVVSGVGFLGAGTIMRAGFNVRGLTTAASLWAVSCVGLACGIGFYAGAIVSAAMICTTLIAFKRIERKLWLRNAHRTVLIRTKHLHDATQAINTLFRRLGIEIRNMDFVNAEDTAAEEFSVLFIVRMPNCSIPDLYGELSHIKEIEGVLIE